MTKDLLIYALGIAVVWLVAMRLRSVKARQVLYLVASWLFYYSWGGWLIVILIFSSLMNYGLGEWLKKKISAGRLWVGLLANLALLCTFKYLPLLGAAASDSSPLAALKRIIFPIGVSFWTFEALSYLLELYREEDLDPTLVEFCLFMSFWPTVIQGPICRMSSLLPQFRQDVVRQRRRPANRHPPSRHRPYDGRPRPPHGRRPAHRRRRRSALRQHLRVTTPASTSGSSSSAMHSSSTSASADGRT